MKRLRVAIFTDTFVPQVNGVAHTLRRLVDYLKARAVPHIVFAPEDEPAPRVPHVFLQPSIRFFLYPECRLAWPNYPTILRLLEDFHPTLVHLVTPFSLGLAGLRYASQFSLPVVASYHTNFADYLRYYGLDFLESLGWSYLRWFHSQARLNLVPSREVGRLLAAHGIGNLRLWRRGIDTGAYSPQHRDPSWRRQLAPGGEVLLLYVGRLAPEKDLPVLLEALRLLNRDLPGRVRLVIAGDGPLRAHLEDVAPENVVFTGYLHGSKLAALYASCDLFVFPSVTETFGNVVLEAMSSRLPVVAAPVGGVADTLRDGQNGLAFCPGDGEDMARAIKKLVVDEALRVRLGQGARAYALGRSWEAAMEELIAAYREALSPAADKERERRCG